MNASEAKSLIDAALQPYRALERAAVVFEELAAAEQLQGDIKKDITRLKKEQGEEAASLDMLKIEVKANKEVLAKQIESNKAAAQKVLDDAQAKSEKMVADAEAETKTLFASQKELKAKLADLEKQIAEAETRRDAIKAEADKMAGVMESALARVKS